jgi:hypothetical protein
LIKQIGEELNQKFLPIFTLRLAGKPAAQDKLTAKAVSANGEVDRPQDETEGFLRRRFYPSVTRFARATSPFVLRKNGEELWRSFLHVTALN